MSDSKKKVKEIGANLPLSHPIFPDDVEEDISRAKEGKNEKKKAQPNIAKSDKESNVKGDQNAPSKKRSRSKPFASVKSDTTNKVSVPFVQATVSSFL